MGGDGGGGRLLLFPWLAQIYSGHLLLKAALGTSPSPGSKLITVKLAVIEGCLPVSPYLWLAWTVRGCFGEREEKRETERALPCIRSQLSPVFASPSIHTTIIVSIHLFAFYFEVLITSELAKKYTERPVPLPLATPEGHILHNHGLP